MAEAETVEGEPEDPETPQEPETDVKMTIWEHLTELRSRLTKCAAGVLAGTIGCWTYREQILGFLAKPYHQAWIERFPEEKTLQLQTLAPADAFVNYMQLAMTGGVIIAIPIIFYQL